jgi:hypothetical protein
MARIGLSSNRKFLRLARALGNKALARGVLEVLWDPCFECGDPYVGTSVDIEAVCDWRGTPGALTAALLEAGAPKGAGFIEPFDGTVRDATAPHYQIHDFFHHCPEYARSKKDHGLAITEPKTCEHCGTTYYGAATRLSRFCGPRCRQAVYRERVREAGVTARDGSLRHVTSRHSYGVSRVPSRVSAPGTSTYVLGSSGGSTPEEDANSTPVRTVRTKSVAAKNSDDPVTIAIVVADDPLVLTFPTIGTDGTEWYLNQSQVDQWIDLYPGIEVLAECRKALGWVLADGTRRKTKRGMLKFLTAWLNRSTERRSPTLLTGSLKTAGNQAALEAFVNRGGPK